MRIGKLCLTRGLFSRRAGVAEPWLIAAQIDGLNYRANIGVHRKSTWSTQLETNGEARLNRGQSSDRLSERKYKYQIFFSLNRVLTLN